MAAIFAIMRELNLSLFTFRYCCAERTVGYIQKKVKPLMNVIIRDFVPTSSSLWCFFFLESPSKSISSTSSSYSKWHFFHRVCASKNPNPFLSGSEGKYIGILLLNTLQSYPHFWYKKSFLSLAEFFLVLLSLVELCWVLLSFTESCLFLLSFVLSLAESYWVLLSFIESCWVLLSFVELCWALLSLV